MLQGRLAQTLSKLTSVLSPLAQLCEGDNLQLPKLSSIKPSHLTTIVWISDQTNPENNKKKKGIRDYNSAIQQLRNLATFKC